MNPKYHGAVFLVSFLFITFFAYIDYAAGFKIHLSVLYMIPVYFCTWFISFRAGAVISLLSSSTLLIGNLFFHHASSANLGIVIFNVLSLFATNTTFSIALALLKKQFYEVHEQLRRDGLTGLLNAEAFFEAAEMERLRSIRYGHPLTLCFLDLDNFKQVNDQRGHLAGNELLKMTGEILKQSIRETDLAARLGGDEFLLLFPETGPAEVEPLIAQIQKSLQAAYQEKLCDTTPSFGVGTYYEKPSSVHLLVSQVDELMYQAKNRGKNQIVTQIFGSEQYGLSPQISVDRLQSFADQTPISTR